MASEGNPGSDPKFQRFAVSVERALKGFEVTKEWHDLISCLARLHKVLLAYTHFHILPHKQLLCKRLSQCLHPNLPGGVHLKVLEVYKVIFDRVQSDGLTRDLFLYASGLFPLLDHASMQVKPHLLDIYEQYFLPLGPGLLPALQGFLLALLPGIEEGSEHIQRVTHLLDSICSAIPPSSFAIGLWNVLLHSPITRQPAAGYILSHLNKGKSHVSVTLKRIEECSSLVVTSLIASLQDSNTLVIRHSLDITSLLLPLHNPTISPSQLTHIITASLQCLLKRDTTLSRRLYSWLLGNTQKSALSNSALVSSTVALTNTSPYFSTFVRPYLLEALKLILQHGAESKSTNDKTGYIVPYRILKALTERAELAEIFPEILPDIVSCFKMQLECLGGVAIIGSTTGLTGLEPVLKKSNKRALRSEVMQSANQLLMALDEAIFWRWVEVFLINGLTDVEKEDAALFNRIDLLLFLLQVLPLPNMEGSINHHIPSLLNHFIQTINHLLPSISLLILKTSTNFVLKVLSLLYHNIQVLETSKTGLTRSLASSPLIQKNSFTEVHPPSPVTQVSSDSKIMDTPLSKPVVHLPMNNSLESISNELFKILIETLQLTQQMTNGFLSQYILKSREIPTSEVVTQAAKDVLECKDVKLSCDHMSCDYTIHDGLELEECMNLICTILKQILEFIMSTKYTIDTSIKTVVSDSSWCCSLMMCCVCTHNPHIFLTALETLLSVWRIECEDNYHFKDIFGSVGIALKGRKEFIKATSIILWNLLSYTSTAHHEETSSLLYLFHQLTQPSTIVEDSLLSSFLHSGSEPFAKFTIFWKYSLSKESITSFKRLTLRIMEGLQSQNPDIHECVTTWVKSVSLSLKLSSALQPLYALITDACPARTKPKTEKPKDPKHATYAKYYYASLEENEIQKEKEEEEEETQSLFYPSLYFTETVDAPRLKYGLSLLMSFLLVDPQLICSSLANAYLKDPDSNNGYTPSLSKDESISLNVSGNHNVTETSETTVPSRPTKLLSNKSRSFLEVLLSYCFELLLTDYPEWLETNSEDTQCLIDVKIASTCLAVRILSSMLQIVSENHSVPAFNGSLNNISYILGLLTLCDVQKNTLTALLHLVDIYTQEYGTPVTMETNPVAMDTHAHNPVTMETHTHSMDTHVNNPFAVYEHTHDPVTMETHAHIPVTMETHTHSMDTHVSNPFAVYEHTHDPVAMETQALNPVAMEMHTVSMDTHASVIPNNIPIAVSAAHMRYRNISVSSIQPLYQQLLKAVHCEIVLESSASDLVESPCVSHLKTRSRNDITSLRELEYVPGNAVTSQPMFLHIVNSILSSVSFSHIHIQLLSILKLSLSSFKEDLDVIAPKILKLICKNIKEIIKRKAHSETSIPPNTVDEFSIENSSNSNTQFSCSSNELIVAYIQAISSIVHYCLLPNICDNDVVPFPKANASSLNPVLHYQVPDPFWDLPSTNHHNMESPFQVSAKSAYNQQEKSSSMFAWLFGGAFSGGDDIEVDRYEEEQRGYCGVSSPAGQKVLWLLQHVYGTVTRLWREYCSLEGRKKRAGSMMRRDVELLLKQFLEPIIKLNPVLFYTSVAQAWMHWNLIGKSKKPLRESLIELMHTFKLQSLEDLLDSISETSENMRRIEKEEKDKGLERERQKHLLHFLYRYLSSPLQLSEEFNTSFSAVVSFLKDTHYVLTTGVELNSHFNSHLVCMLTSILHVFVCRVPIPEIQTNKKQRRDLQEMIYKLCDSLSQYADRKFQMISQDLITNKIEQPPIPPDTTDLTSTNADIKTSKMKNGNQEGLEELSNDFQIPNVKHGIQSHDCHVTSEIQAMAVLSNVLSHFIDCVYNSSEKDRVSSLLKTVFKSVWPAIRNYSVMNSGTYSHAVKLLASLSEFQVTRKCWKDEVLEVFLDPVFFIMEKNCIFDWKVTIDNLMSQDKAVFSSLLSRLHVSSSSTAAGMVNIFTSVDPDRLQRARLLKRMCFVILCGEHDQYSSLLSQISEKLVDSSRWYSCPLVNAQILLAMRVLLVRLSSNNLVSLWPTLLSELSSALCELQSDLGLELVTPLTVTKEKLNWYWCACKLLETAFSLPYHVIPHWQIVCWGYFGGSYGEVERDIVESDKDDENDTTKQNEGIEDQFVEHGVVSEMREGKRGLLEDILHVYKEHNQQLRLPPVSHLPPLWKLTAVVQLVPFLEFLQSRGTYHSTLLSSDTSSASDHVTSDVEEIVRDIFIDFVEY